MNSRSTVLRCALPASWGVLLALTGCGAPSHSLEGGTWKAWLDSPGGELRFGLDIRDDAGALRAFLVNGEERIPVPRVEWVDGQLTLEMPHYDSIVTATIGDDDRRLDGVWRKTSGPDTESRLDFHAELREADGSVAEHSIGVEASRAFDGRWLVDFDGSDEPAVAVFRVAPDGEVAGTVLTTTGDYRYLAGTLARDRLRLSCFDGAHAFLFDARLQTDGTLAGDFWSRDSWHETWTALRDSEAALPDAFELTSWVESVDLGALFYPDLDGRPRSLDDPAFAGRARIIEVFGSWCPNCNDAARLLAQLERDYGARGLSILGLAFELTGEQERDAEQVRRFASHHGLEFPMLVAGLANKASASESFPLIDRVRSYPTTIFLYGDGRVRAVHQGYSGPATGEPYAALRERFVAIVEELLAEGGSPP